MFLFSCVIMGGIMLSMRRMFTQSSDPDLGTLITDRLSTNLLDTVHSKKYYFWFWLTGTLFFSILMLVAFLYS